MAPDYDDTKVTGDRGLSTDWNALVAAMKAKGLPQDIDKRGSDFTGSNPTKTLAITTTTQAKTAGITLVRNGRFLHSTHEYTVTIAATTLTITLVGLSINDTDYFDGGYFL